MSPSSFRAAATALHSPLYPDDRTLHVAASMGSRKLRCRARLSAGVKSTRTGLICLCVNRTGSWLFTTPSQSLKATLTPLTPQEVGAVQPTRRRVRAALFEFKGKTANCTPLAPSTAANSAPRQGVAWAAFSVHTTASLRPSAVFSKARYPSGMTEKDGVITSPRDAMVCMAKSFLMAITGPPLGSARAGRARRPPGRLCFHGLHGYYTTERAGAGGAGREIRFPAGNFAKSSPVHGRHDTT